MTKSLVKRLINWLNDFPSSNNISKTTSPSIILQGVNFHHKIVFYWPQVHKWFHKGYKNQILVKEKLILVHIFGVNGYYKHHEIEERDRNFFECLKRIWRILIYAYFYWLTTAYIHFGGTSNRWWYDLLSQIIISRRISTNSEIWITTFWMGSRDTHLYENTSDDVQYLK